MAFTLLLLPAAGAARLAGRTRVADPEQWRAPEVAPTPAHAVPVDET
ncbi:hypothetical protein [Streptomyces sp. NBC_00859]|nr:hypothetical protein OG584_33955 [Streptomyces sp. NBC_00859]